MHLLALIGRGGLAYGIGSVTILIAALIIGVVGRHRNESKPERQQEDARAAALIDRNAQAAGWGAPRQRHQNQ
jgi:hypothetical protein